MKTITLCTTNGVRLEVVPGSEALREMTENEGTEYTLCEALVNGRIQKAFNYRFVRPTLQHKLTGSQYDWTDTYLGDFLQKHFIVMTETASPGSSPVKNMPESNQKPKPEVLTGKAAFRMLMDAEGKEFVFRTYYNAERTGETKRYLFTGQYLRCRKNAQQSEWHDADLQEFLCSLFIQIGEEKPPTVPLPASCYWEFCSDTRTWDIYAPPSMWYKTVDGQSQKGFPNGYIVSMPTTIIERNCMLAAVLAFDISNNIANTALQFLPPDTDAPIIITLKQFIR